MIIAFSSMGKDWDAKVDSRFGRAEGFLLLNDENNELTWIENKQNYNAAHGAGIQAAQTIASNNAEVLITGNVGPKAYKVLQSSDVKIYIKANQFDIKTAYDKFKKSELELATNPTTVGMG